jgi:hypothetical protein
MMAIVVAFSLFPFVAQFTRVVDDVCERRFEKEVKTAATIRQQGCQTTILQE